MTDSLKFGPEWLRNLSQDGPSTGSGGGGPRYQLAEHRYGREEMLALFDKTLGQPEILGRFKSLYVERLQPPLALAPSQEEETNLTNRGGWMPRPLTGGGGVSSLRGGRGGGVSVDRGRGRGGRGGYHSQNIVGGGGPSQMGMPYQRSQSVFDAEDIGIRIGRPRPWGEQNGETEWNGTTSPRKEYIATGRANMDNWRRHRGTDDDDGWRNPTEQQQQRRTEKWGRSGGTASSWRDGDATGGGGGAGQEGSAGGDREQLSRGIERLERELRERGGSASDRGDRVSYHQQQSGGGGGGGASAVTRSWNARKPWDVDDILPEWAMENPSESGGTFDASGAFHGSDDEHDRSSRLNHSHSTNSIHSSPRPATLSRSQTQGSILVNKHSNGGSNNADISKHRLKENPVNETSHSDEESNYMANRSYDDTNSSRKSKPDREISIEHLEPEQKPQTVEKSKAKKKESESKTQSDSSSSKNKTDSDTSKPIAATVSPKKNKKNAKEDSDFDDKKKGGRKMMSSDSSTDDLSSDSSSFGKKEEVVKISQEENKKDSIKSQPQYQQQQQQPDEFARMQEVADDIVAQLMMDEERTPPALSAVVGGGQQLLSQALPVTLPGVLPNVHGVMPLLSPAQPVIVPLPGSDKWFYRDPQGEVQGPFLASEMSEWYRAGYFTNELLVRRGCDDRYTTLGELVKICGGVVPFNSSTRFPPLKQIDTSVLNVNGLQSPLATQPGQVHPQLIPGTPQYRQAQLLSRQIAARQEAQVQVLRELSRSERWSTMTPGEQNAVLMQQLAQIPFPDPYVTSSAPAGLGITPPTAMPMSQPTTTLPQSNPLLQLISQMQQQKSSLLSQVPSMVDPTKPAAPTGLGGLNHLSGLTGHHTGIPMPGAMNHMNNLNHMPASALHHHVLNQNIPPPISTPDSLLGGPQNSDAQKGEDITSMFQQLFSKAASNKQQTNDQQPTANNSWNPSWSVVSGIGSMWDMPISKPEMKTEQQILEEQMRLRKEAEEKEEQKRQIEEALKTKEKEQREKAKKQLQELEDKAKAKKEAEEKEKAEQKRKQQQLAEQQKKQQQEQEQKTKKEQEAKSKKEAEEKRLRELEEKRRQKEERKEAELKRKQEAELSSKKKQEAEQEKAKEEARQRQLEEEKEKEREKQQKAAAAEAKRQQLQQQQQQQQAMVNSSSNKAAPWRPPMESLPNSTGNLTLAEIQKLEREKRAEQLKEQQAQQLAMRQQQAALLKEQELAAANERSAMQLKWANQKPQNSTKVKSFAEIQAEEMAKQAAAERLAAQQRERESPVVQQAQSIWSSPPSMNWANSAWSASSNTGFWDETPTIQPQTNKIQTAKSNGKQSSPQQQQSNNKSTISTNSNKNQQSNAHSNHNGGQKLVNSTTTNVQSSKHHQVDKANNAASNNNNNNPNNNGSSKKKKKDDKDDFTNWCTKAMSSINGSVDAPTFISFLNEIDSPYEVKDYIRTYLGDSKEAVDFSKQFLEKRSRFRNQQRLASAHIDDMCSPAPAINPGSEFHEGKGKKSKKNKMQKVDNRILGFNVTAAQDRINIGDRDYGDAN